MSSYRFCDSEDDDFENLANLERGKNDEESTFSLSA